MGATDERVEPRSTKQQPVIDLTADAGSGQWLAASAKVGYLEPEVSRRRRRGKSEEPIAVPQGEQHAYRAGHRITACGLRLSALHPWDDRPFNDGLLNRCAECVQHTRQAGTSADG